MPTQAALPRSARLAQRLKSDQPDATLASPADPWGLAQWGLFGGQAARFWMDGWLQGQQVGQSLLQAWALPGSESLHVMPDSAGPALCPPDDFTPAGLTRSALGGWLAWMAAWSTALRHELQDLEESRSGVA